ncbi:MAG: glucose-1-phosphate cytidylyltransferase [Anaerolineales bacterium]
MKVVILAGGVGTRLTEETEVRPKPMVEIGGKPILWHILRHYYHFGFKDFILALGYRGEDIKRYFWDYYQLSGNMAFDFAAKQVHETREHHEDWKIQLVDTGLDTMTGGRIKRLEPWLENKTFMATYGDGVSNVDLQALLEFHRAHHKLATITAVRPPARFGGIIFNGDLVEQFTEKPQVGEGWINGGFMIFEPKVLEYLQDDQSILETHALEKLAADGELAAYRHTEFWQCMDTLRDKRLLENLWREGRAPWII